MTDLPTIGFIGLGNMGGPMCRRLLAAGHPVVAFDLSAEALAAAVAAGARPAAAAEECGEVDVLVTALPRPEAVLAVMVDSGLLASLRPGTIWVDTTTNRRSLVLELAAAAPEGVATIEAPVTGAVDGARLGRLTIFAGGDPDDIARAEPVLSRLGTVLRCGALGSGNVVKLVTNQLWFVAAAALGEALAVGVANGADLRTLWQAITSSVGDSFVARHDAPSIFAGHYDPTFNLGLCLKDLGLVEELAGNVASALPMTQAAAGAFALAAERYGMQAPELMVAKRIEDEAGLSLRLDGDWVPHWER